jgi:hypothetical protein
MNAAHFEDLIFRRGKMVLWERAQRCTCWNADSGQPAVYCKACGGTGFLYDHPFQSKFILITGLNINKEQTQMGEVQLGDCIATVPYRTKVIASNGLISYPDNPLYEIGEWDKITLLDSEFKSNENLVRGTPLFGRPPDTLYHGMVTKVIRILQADPDTGVVTYYTPDVDYKLNGNVIEWQSNGKQPAEGSQYSALYMHRPVYIVQNQLPQVRDQDGQHFPKRVVLRYKGVN